MSPLPKQNEKLQLAFLIAVTFSLFGILFFTSSLRPVALLTLLNVMMLGPIIQFLSLKKIPRLWGILIVYAILSLFFVFGLTRLIQGISQQWTGFIESIPMLSAAILSKIDQIENSLKDRMGIELNLGFRNSITEYTAQIQSWALTHIPAIIGNLASAALLVPIFSFFILKDGEKFNRLYLDLIPERFSKTASGVINKITAALATFLRAKLLEALLFGLMTYFGLIVLDAPYAGLFALINGLANFIPYIGPFIGAIPPLLIFGFSSTNPNLFWPAVILFVVINLIDNLLIFPVFVARIVNLSPLTLLISVAVGQELYGVVGMLIAVPFASIVKIIFLEIKPLIYS